MKTSHIRIIHAVANYHTLSKSSPLSSRDETTLAIGTGEISGYCYTLITTYHTTEMPRGVTHFVAL